MPKFVFVIQLKLGTYLLYYYVKFTKETIKWNFLLYYTVYTYSFIKPIL